MKSRKAQVAAVIGVVVTALAAFFPDVMSLEVQGAVTTIFMTAAVWLVPN